jgi:hypothetical protein
VDNKRLSVVFELEELRQVLLSGRLLADLLANDGLPDTWSAAQAPRMLEALFAVAAARVRLLSLVVQEAAEASLLVGPENWSPEAPDGDPDVLLPRTRKGKRT